ncbi:MAG TPA: hypothetical protein VMV80_01965 [Anaerolineales bacterium]|nr:hypothetical protein [Anaerolineales bacterium]
MKSLFTRLREAVNTDENRMSILASALDRGAKSISDGGVIDGSSRVWLVDTSAGAATVTLPKLEDAQGEAFYVKNGGANGVTLEGDGAETIDGAANKALAAQYDVIHVAAGTSEWHVLSAS